MVEITLESNSVGIEKQEYICVYILQLSNGTYYTGMTNNIGRRMGEHDSGMSRSTKRFLPVKLIFSLRLIGRQTARKLEVQIKHTGAKRWLNKLRFSQFRSEYDIQIEPNEWNT